MNNLKINAKTGFETVKKQPKKFSTKIFLGSQIFEANFENRAEKRGRDSFRRSSQNRAIGTRLSRQNDRSVHGSSNEIAQKRKQKVLAVNLPKL